MKTSIDRDSSKFNKEQVQMISKRLSRRNLVWMLVVMFFLWLGLNALLYFQLALDPERLLSLLPFAAGESPAPDAVETARIDLLYRFAGYSAGIFLVGSLLLGLITRRISAALEPNTVATQAKDSAKLPARPAEVETSSERFYLHLLTVFQRDGRLLDFFSEELSQYTDEQIGAAARAVHDGCRKALEKHVTPMALIDTQEGERYTVEPGFDPAKIKLTGNVTGEPPFNGIVRHRGWQADRIRIPKLAGDWDARIIAPAEIEIM
jgi:hypothetical protein